MKIAYFDCFAGVSGDMILGALIDAGWDVENLALELKKLKISGYKIGARKVAKKGIASTKVTVQILEQNVERKLRDIVSIIDQSDLGDNTKSLSKKIFQELAVVESRIHNKNPEDIHFHELSGLDTIIEVVGALVGIQKLGFDAVYASRIHLGTGFVECRHGTLPVPAPATLELLKGVPVYSQGIEGELTTPTGAAILKTIVQRFGDMPEMEIEKIGYGSGSKDLPIPSLLRIYVGETHDLQYKENKAILIEMNLDDPGLNLPQ